MTPTATLSLPWPEDGRMNVDPESARVQWLGGFYPAGAIIALEIRFAGGGRLEQIYNPAAPEVVATLRRCSKCRELELSAKDVEMPAVTIHHGSQARQELQTLLDKAQKHIVGLRRLNWEQTVKAFNDLA